MTSFLPEDYHAPEGAYYKFKDGDNTFRIISSAVTGYEYWNTENKPVRSKIQFTLPLINPKLDKEGKCIPKHFWAFVVLGEGSITPQIMQVTQKSVQSAIKSLVDNNKWGDPKGYDITINKKGDGLLTEYSIMPNPHSPVVEVDISHINLQALFDGENPLDGLEKELKTKK